MSVRLTRAILSLLNRVLAIESVKIKKLNSKRIGNVDTVGEVQIFLFLGVSNSNY